ncbi:peptide transporter family 1-like isoform X2 [Sipha flava]|uniref:Peptide transporter family 1-like isoform X2 n=1 Tax=Sipha flava TaxID=143950 RepID=A0A8B8G478_9HEMI|nr:peptide transporter family 1-like isoform X2 [Sipha flava]
MEMFENRSYHIRGGCSCLIGFICIRIQTRLFQSVTNISVQNHIIVKCFKNKSIFFQVNYFTMGLMCYDQNKTLKTPKSVWIILLVELCEQFSYYVFRTVLVLYLTRVLYFNEDISTIIHHSCVFLSYFMSFVGAILADTYWGKFKTIIRLSAVNVLGSMILTSASMSTNVFSLNIQKVIALLGLLVISVGAGGIKPCVFAFGSDQFQLPQHVKQFQRFIVKFMIAVSIGALATSFATLELRESVLHRFRKNNIYPLAFGVPAALMLIATVVLASGRNVCTKMKPDNHAVFRTIGCMFYGLRAKCISSRSPRNNHWLDNAKDEYTETEISEMKTFLNVITVFTAYPMYWALYEQSSRWTLQATLMDGRLEYLDWSIKADQMQMITSIFGLVFLFLFNYTLYPLLKKLGVRKPLQNITLSSCLAVIGFIFAALLQFEINGDDPVIPPKEGRLNIYNGFDCNVILHSPTLHVDKLGALEMINVNYMPISQEEIVEIKLQFDAACTFVPENVTLNTTVTVAEGKEISYYLTRSNLTTIELTRIGIYDNLTKNKHGNPILRVLMDYSLDFEDNISLENGDKNVHRFPSFRGMDFIPMKIGKYSLCWNGIVFPMYIELFPATFYTLILQKNDQKIVNLY